MVNNLCPNMSTCYDYWYGGRGCDGCNLAYNTVNRTSDVILDILDKIPHVTDTIADYFPQPTPNSCSFRLPRVVFYDGHHEDMIMFKPKSGRDFEFYIPSGYYAYKGEMFKYHQEHIKVNISENPEYDISDCWFPDTEISGIEGLNINCSAVIGWDTDDYTD